MISRTNAVLAVIAIAASTYNAYWLATWLRARPPTAAPVSEGIPRGQVRGICAPGVRTGAVTCNSDALPPVGYGEVRP